MDITTPGFARLPVCSPDRAFQSWDTVTKGGTSNYPCDTPPARTGAALRRLRTRAAMPPPRCRTACKSSGIPKVIRTDKLPLPPQIQLPSVGNSGLTIPHHHRPRMILQIRGHPRRSTITSFPIPSETPPGPTPLRCSTTVDPNAPAARTTSGLATLPLTTFFQDALANQRRGFSPPLTENLGACFLDLPFARRVSSSEEARYGISLLSAFV